jgi:hypothetical protein
MRRPLLVRYRLALGIYQAGGYMETRKLNGEDVRILNERILSNDEKISRKAEQQLRHCLDVPDAFCDSTAEEWARRIIKRISRMEHH